MLKNKGFLGRHAACTLWEADTEGEARKMKITTWSVSVAVDGHVGVCSGDITLAKALERGIQSATYYKTIHPDAIVTIQDVVEQCPKCWNSGTITRVNSRSARRVRCPECKGKGAHGTLDPITFKLSDDSSRIRLVQTA